MFVQTKIILILLGLIGIMGAATYYGYGFMQDKIDAEQKKNVELTIANKSQEAHIKKLEEDRVKQEEIRAKVDADFSKARKQVEEMRRKFEGQTKSGTPKNIGKAAIEKPSIIQNAVNQGTDDQARCFEILSGSPLTQDELNGKVKNKICPEYFPTK